MSDKANLIEQVVNALDSMNSPYMIGGSVALIAWSSPRATHDLDLVLDLPDDRIREFCSRFPHDRFYIDPEAMRATFQDRDKPGLDTYSFLDMTTGLKVDLFPLRTDDAAQQVALQRRINVQVIGKQRASIYAPDDLLVQKSALVCGQRERAPVS